jgi:hypothetical protein
VRRHDTDATSLVFGLIFLGVVGIWALNQNAWVDLPDLSVLGPALLVVAGVIGLATTLGASARGQNRRAESATIPTEVWGGPASGPAAEPAPEPAGEPARDAASEPASGPAAGRTDPPS